MLICQIFTWPWCCYTCTYIQNGFLLKKKKWLSKGFCLPKGVHPFIPGLDLNQYIIRSSLIQVITWTWPRHKTHVILGYKKQVYASYTKCIEVQVKYLIGFSYITVPYNLCFKAFYTFKLKINGLLQVPWRSPTKIHPIVLIVLKVK